jgi:hypothetical protein
MTIGPVHCPLRTPSRGSRGLREVGVRVASCVVPSTPSSPAQQPSSPANRPFVHTCCVHRKSRMATRPKRYPHLHFSCNHAEHDETDCCVHTTVNNATLPFARGQHDCRHRTLPEWNFSPAAIPACCCAMLDKPAAQGVLRVSETSLRRA